MILNTKFITFKVNNTQSIIIKNLCYEGDHLYRWDPIEIVFKDKNTEYIINQHDHLMPQLEYFYYFLQRSIKNKLQLLKSIKENLGFLWHQDLHICSIISQEELENKEDWKGARYLIWGGGEFDTWLYNQNNKIYLEITPRYPWHFSDPTKEVNFIPEDFISFDEWIKSYKPLALIEIDKTTAQQWLEQTKFLMKEIKKADKKYLHTPQDEIDE